MDVERISSKTLHYESESFRRFEVLQNLILLNILEFILNIFRIQ